MALPIANSTSTFLNHKVLLFAAGERIICHIMNSYCSAVSMDSPLYHIRRLKHLKGKPFYAWDESEEILDKSVSPNSFDMNSRLHPQIKQIAKDLIDSEISPELLEKVTRPSRTIEMGQRIESGIEKRFKEKLRVAEEKLLYKELSGCQKVALVLKEDKSLKLAQKLRKENHRYVSIGEETFVNVSLGFALKGVINPIIIRRLKCLEVAGLWNWWQKFVQGQNDVKQFNNEKFIQYEKPTISGNIIVIFSSLLFGWSVAALGFVMEKHGLNIIFSVTSKSCITACSSLDSFVKGLFFRICITFKTCFGCSLCNHKVDIRTIIITVQPKYA